MRKLVWFEWSKIFRKRLTQAALLAALLLTVSDAAMSYRNMYACDGSGREGSGRIAVTIDKTVAEKYEGVLTDEKVRRILAEFKPNVDLHGMNAVYFYQNALQSSVFARFSDQEGNWNGRCVADVFGRKTIRVGYTYGWLTTSRNMQRAGIVLSFVILIMLVPVFAGEYGGADQVILTCRYGKTRCITAKLAAGVLAAFFVTAGILCIQAALAFAFYGADGLECSILFAPVEYVEGGIPFDMTCGVMIWYQVLLAFMASASVAGIAFVLSAVCRSQTAALAASAAVYTFPMLLPVSERSAWFRYVVLLPLYQSQFFRLMSVAQLGNGLNYALWAVPAAFLFLGGGMAVSRRAFAGRQI